jgi:hypothetical protein
LQLPESGSNGGWCGDWGLETPGYPIGRLMFVSGIIPTASFS